VIWSIDRDATLPSRRGPRAARRRSVRGGLCLSLAVGLVINTFSTTATNAYPLKREQQDWALVAMNELVDLTESQCWVELIWRESTFNPLAVNGSHYGLAQMKSKWYRDLKPRAQVKAHIKYLKHRYPKADGKPSACLALNHLKRKGWH